MDATTVHELLAADELVRRTYRRSWTPTAISSSIQRRRSARLRCAGSTMISAVPSIPATRIARVPVPASIPASLPHHSHGAMLTRSRRWAVVMVIVPIRGTVGRRGGVPTVAQADWHRMIRCPDMSRREVHVLARCAQPGSRHRRGGASYLEKILPDHDLASEMQPRRINPHLVRHGRIIGRDQVREYERLDARQACHPSRVLR